MRTSPLALALVLAACHGADRRPAAGSTESTASATANGPDQLALRFPRSGGLARAYAFPRLDSLVWSAKEKAPPLAHLIAFDDGAGSVLAEDAKGAAVRIDLRLGDVSRDPAPKLAGLASADGIAAYGIAQDGSVTRLTQAGSWNFRPPSAAHDVVPQPDGTLLVLGNRGNGTIAWLIRPPDAHVMDSVLLPRVSRAIRTPAGDRVYFPVDSGLVGVRGRDLQIVPSIRLRARPRAVVTSPSGDRIYATTDSSTELLVIDRYSSNVTMRITLPTPPTALRMDPTGRYVLARAASGDSAYVIAVGTDRVTGAVATEWRADLPAVASNGWIAVVRGRDVVFVDAESQATVRTVAGGAADDWMFVTWNGFRPRAAGLDQPVTFETNDSSQSDTTENPFAGQIPGADTLATEGAPPAAPPAPRAAPPDSARTGFTVQFAALRAQDAATDVLHSVHVQGGTPRIVATARDGVTIYRVVIGPFATREDAERVARTSGKSYWVYQGAP